MLNESKVTAMIPARKGSQRLPRKNTALVGSKPLIQHVIEAAKGCRYFDEVVVNTDDEKVQGIAKSLTAKIYERKAEHATSEARSDEVVFEFMEHHACDILVWVNPTSPLQTSKEMEDALQYFQENKLDSLFTIYNEKVHCNFNKKPLNYDPAESFAQTQALEPIERFVYSLMMWKCSTFKETYKHTGKAMFCGKTGTFPVSRLSSLIVKNAEDLMIVDLIARCRLETYQVSYFGENT
jgi:CMP-N-acetylneuraminic acid synthetase